MSFADLELAHIRLSDAGLTPAVLAQIGSDPYLAQRIVQLATEHTANAQGDLRNAYSTDTRPVAFNGNTYDWEEVMEWRIRYIAGFTSHSRTTLTSQGITRLRTLTSLSMSQLDKLYNMGPKSIGNVTSVLRSMGLAVLGKTLRHGVPITIGARPQSWRHMVTRELLLELDICDLTPPPGWTVQSHLLTPPISKLKDLLDTNSSHWTSLLEAQVLEYNHTFGEANGFINPKITDTIVWLKRLQEDLL